MNEVTSTRVFIAIRCVTNDFSLDSFSISKKLSLVNQFIKYYTLIVKKNKT